MTKEFINKVFWYGSYDTKKYRYVAGTDFQDCYMYIKRIDLKLLDTTAAYDPDNWKKVFDARTSKIYKTR